MYSDYVLNEIIKRFENKSAFIIYASDHGFSLGEGGLFTNGYAGDNAPPEQLSIAFFTWASDKFIQNNEANYKNILGKKSQHISHD